MSHFAKVENGKPTRSAVVDKSGLVVNVVVTDGPDDDIPGFKLIESETAKPGDSFADGVLVLQKEPEQLQMTDEEIAAHWKAMG